MLGACSRRLTWVFLVGGFVVSLGLAGCGRRRVPTAAPAPPRPATPLPVAVRPAAPLRPPTIAGRRPTLGSLRDATRKANIVICVLDATRADRVGCYGYPRPTTPNLDRLARESVVFREHFSPAPSTKPSTASLFTSLYPDAHCVIEQGGLSPGTFTLAGGLRAKGWQTAIFTSNVNASPEVGLGAGFEEAFPASFGLGRVTVRAAAQETGNYMTPEVLARAFGQWLSTKPPGRFFAYVHLLPPHTPYAAPDRFGKALAGTPPPPVRRGTFPFSRVAPHNIQPTHYRPEQWADLYDANLRWGDWGVGEVVRLLRARGLLDTTLLVVTADHGEAFGEHGYVYHTRGLYDELLHIPLIIRFPGRIRPVGEVGALTQTVDLLPTICELCRVPYPKGTVQGHSLLPLLTGAQSQVRDFVFASAQEDWPSYLVRNSEWSLILYRGQDLRALYNLKRDPGQTRNTIAEHPEAAAKLAAAFEVFARTQRRSAAVLLSPDTPWPKLPRGQLSEQAKRALKALGYLN